LKSKKKELEEIKALHQRISELKSKTSHGELDKIIAEQENQLKTLMEVNGLDYIANLDSEFFDSKEKLDRIDPIHEGAYNLEKMIFDGLQEIKTCSLSLIQTKAQREQLKSQNNDRGAERKTKILQLNKAIEEVTTKLKDGMGYLNIEHPDYFNAEVTKTSNLLTRYSKRPDMVKQLNETMNKLNELISIHQKIQQLQKELSILTTETRRQEVEKLKEL